MSKLQETMAQHPDMDPDEITRIEVRKVADPLLRAGLEAVIDLVGVLAGKTADLYERLQGTPSTGEGIISRVERKLMQRNALTEEQLEAFSDKLVDAIIDEVHSRSSIMADAVVVDTLGGPATQQEVNEAVYREHPLDALARNAGSIAAQQAQGGDSGEPKA